jgi:hypothetical protein
MNKAIAKVGLPLAYPGLMVLAVFCTYTLTRCSFVRAPLRAFYSDPGAFRDYVDAWKQGDARESGVGRALASHGVSSIRVESNYVFFIFPGLPPDAYEVIGCPLEEGLEPTDLPRSYTNRKTFHFEMIDREWFYWQFDPWGQKLMDAEVGKQVAEVG